MKAKIKDYKRQILWVGFIFLSISILILSCVVAQIANAAPDKEGHYVIPEGPDDRSAMYWEADPEAKDDNNTMGLFRAYTTDFTNPLRFAIFISRARSYITVDYDEAVNHTSYAFNTPNLPQLIINFLNCVNSGGWNGTHVRHESKPVDECKTALEKYGYELPNQIYLGEYPYTTLNVQDLSGGFLSRFKNGTAVVASVLVNDTGIGIALKWLFTGSFEKVGIALGTCELNDIKTVVPSTSDYTDQDAARVAKYGPWLSAHWEIIKSTCENDDDIKLGEKSIFADGNITSNGEVVGDVDDPLNNQISGTTLLNRIIERGGDEAGVILGALCDKAWHRCGNIRGPHDYITRNMPYDIESMSPACKEYMNNISDPRVMSFADSKGLLGFPRVLFKVLQHNLGSGIYLNATKALCESAGNMDSICTLGFFRGAGMDIWIGWTNVKINHLIMIALAMLAIFVLIKGAIKVGLGQAALPRIIGIVLLLFLAIGFLAIPEQTTSAIELVAGKALSLGDEILAADQDGFSELYTSDADEDEKSKLRFWATYFNIWSNYAVNHTLGDKIANKFDTNQISDDAGNTNVPNEYKQWNVTHQSQNSQKNGTSWLPELKGGHQIKLWNVVLLEELSQNREEEALRAIDHYIAPTITSTGNYSFSVSQNKNYNGVYPYSIPPVGGILIALVIFALAFMKFLCFIELVVDLILLLLRVVTGAFQGKAKIKEEFKGVFFSFIRVFIYDVFITVVCYISFVATSTTMFFIALILAGITVAFFKWLFFTQQGKASILKPGITGLIGKMVTAGVSKVKSVAQVAGSDISEKRSKKDADKVKENKEKMKDDATAKEQKEKKMDDGSEGKDRKNNIKQDEDGTIAADYEVIDDNKNATKESHNTNNKSGFNVKNTSGKGKK